MLISNKVTIDDAEIKVGHEECSNPSWCRDKEIFVESCSDDNNTLSTIVFNDYLTVYVFWDSHPVGVSQEILFVSETGVLFIGCGSISARICTKTSRVLDTNDICLFWGLENLENYVLETGELECFLYSKSGDQISSAEVDPPYEMKMTEKGIEFESIVHGTTWLKYAGNG